MFDHYNKLQNQNKTEGLATCFIQVANPSVFNFLPNF